MTLIADPESKRYRFEMPAGSSVVSLWSAPEKLELELESGTWVIVVVAIWSTSDIAMLAMIPAIGEKLASESRVAVRPFSDARELETWCSVRYRGGSPLWILLRDGQDSVVHHGPWWKRETAVSSISDAIRGGVRFSKLRLPFGLPWTRALTFGVLWNVAILAAGLVYCVAMQLWLFEAVAERYSNVGAAMPLNFMAAYNLMWPTLGVLIALSAASFAIPNATYRDVALWMAALAATLALGNGLYAFVPTWLYSLAIHP